MDRATIFQGQLPLETDLLRAQQYVLIGLGELARACVGSNTIANGFALSATSPASMVLNFGPGHIYTPDVVERSQWSSLAQDSRPLLKQGISLTPPPLTFTAPSTSGFAQNYLIQAAYSESDAVPQERPYYNAAQPDVGFQGPGNDGLADNTARLGTVTMSAKPGVAAASGTQVTPPPDPGYIGLYVVTITQGQTQITSASWTKILASFIPVKLPEIPADVQNAVWTYVQGTGTASALQASISPAPIALVAGMKVDVRSPFTNTGNVTFNLNGLGNKAVLARDGTQLNPGDIVNGQIVTLSYNGASWQLQSDRSTIAASVSIPDSQLWHMGVATSGTATAMVTTLSPVPASIANDFCFRVPITLKNGASPTIDFGFGAKSIVLDATGVAPTGGEMPGSVGFRADFQWDATNGIVRLINSVFLQGGQINTQIFDTPGTYTYTPTSGTRWIKVVVQGAGGAGTGNTAVGSGFYTVSGGGGGGGYAIKKLFLSTTGVSGATITVGTKGAGVAGSAAAASGGSSSFGAFASATGGQGATANGAVANGTSAEQAGGLGGVGSGGDTNGVGQSGGFGSATSASNLTSGYGGGSYWGYGAGASSGEHDGAIAISPGAGGAGGASSTTTRLGGDGQNGRVYIEEYS